MDTDPPSPSLSPRLPQVEREKVAIQTEALDPSLIFEQEPSQILDALLPLYLNSCLLRSLQESLASELAARMNAMNSATDNAKELGKVKKAQQGACAHCYCVCMDMLYCALDKGVCAKQGADGCVGRWVCFVGGRGGPGLCAM